MGRGFLLYAPYRHFYPGLPVWGGRKLGVGWRLVYDVAVAQAGEAGEPVDGVGTAMQSTGDLGQVVPRQIGSTLRERLCADLRQEFGLHRLVEFLLRAP